MLQAARGAWTIPLQHRQIVAHVGLPITGDAMPKALELAREEVSARTALLGPGGSSTSKAPPKGKRLWLAAALMAAGGIAAVVFALTHHENAKTPPIAVARESLPRPVAIVQPSTPVQPAESAPPADEQVDALLEKAREAMSERHYIDPAAGSALTSYREALGFDPQNGEAQQGLQRLAEILIARVQSSLDERKFDIALQSLETARSIDPNEPRLAALDERIAELRAELGPTQILAALNAQNFDRAAQLIDDAARAKSLAPAKLAQLRDEVHRRRSEFDVLRFTKLIDTRLQQDHLIEPRTDSAAYYLDQARQAGASAATLQPQMTELERKLPLAAHNAIEQRHFGEADRLLNAMRTLGMPPVAIAGLQHDLGTARSQQPAAKSDQLQSLELAQLRIGQGKLLEPANDSALFYVKQMLTADPNNPGLPQIVSAVQTQIVDRARAALDSGDREKAESLTQAAAALGSSSDVDAFTAKLRQSAGAPTDAPLLTEQSLTRLNKLDVQYPYDALRAGTDGWVEIGYIVGADGTVSNVHVLNATPKRTFDSAAIKAVKNLRYQPVMQGGRSIAVNTQLRVVFRLPK